MFRIIYHDFSSNAFHFWLYIDGHPLQAKKFVANFEIMNDKKEAVMSGNNEGIPWDIPVAQVKFKFFKENSPNYSRYHEPRELYLFEN